LRRCGSHGRLWARAERTLARELSEGELKARARRVLTDVDRLANDGLILGKILGRHDTSTSIQRGSSVDGRLALVCENGTVNGVSSMREHEDVQNQSGPYHEIFSRVLAYR
jgi:hypothetical protein